MEKSPISKKVLRREVLDKRDAMSEEERRRASVLLTERILGHQWFYRSDIVLGFVSYGSEISTTEILEEALKAGKKLYVPKIVSVSETESEVLCGNETISGKTEMKFYRIKSLAELTPPWFPTPQRIIISSSLSFS